MGIMKKEDDIDLSEQETEEDEHQISQKFMLQKMSKLLKKEEKKNQLGSLGLVSRVKKLAQKLKKKQNSTELGSELLPVPETDPTDEKKEK